MPNQAYVSILALDNRPDLMEDGHSNLPLPKQLLRKLVYDRKDTLSLLFLTVCNNTTTEMANDITTCFFFFLLSQSPLTEIIRPSYPHLG